jgi:hypothetical protein
MPRVCTVCTHPDRADIDAALVRGVSPYDLETIYSDLKRAAIERHKLNHLPTSLLKAQEAQEMADADRMLAELQEVKADVWRLKSKAEEGGDYRTAMSGFTHALKALELQAKLTQLISDAPQLNLYISPEWMELRAVIVQALEPYPEASYEVLRAIEGVSNGNASG